MFEKLTFKNDAEKQDFEIQKKINGLHLYRFAYQVLLINNELKPIPYEHLLSVLEFDIELSTVVFKYIKRLERHFKAILCSRFEVDPCIDIAEHSMDLLPHLTVKTNDRLSHLFYKFNFDFPNLVRVCLQKDIISHDRAILIVNLYDQITRYNTLLFHNENAQKSLRELINELYVLSVLLPSEVNVQFIDEITSINERFLSCNEGTLSFNIIEPEYNK